MSSSSEIEQIHEHQTPTGRLSRLAWLIVLAVCAVLYWPFLGHYGFRGTEGHRVIPAWNMVESGDWLVPRMFGTAYLRKPPGMQWAIAASSMIFGETEFGARAVSATVSTGMALLAWWFAAQWFGWRWGVAAGLAQALYPQFWSTARGAEIEAINNFGTMASALMIVHIMIGMPIKQRNSIIRQLAAGFCLAIALLVMTLAKGPAGVPVAGAAVIVGCALPRDIKRLFRPALIAGVVLAAVVLTLLALAIMKRLEATGEAVIRENSASDFMWDTSKLVSIVLLLPTALVFALPWSLSLLALRRGKLKSDVKDVADQAKTDAGIAATQWRIARGLGFTCLLALFIYTVLGISNPRYAIPATTLLAPLTGFALKRLSLAMIERGKQKSPPALGMPALWIVVLFAVAVGVMCWKEPQRGASSGRDAGIELAASLPNGAVIWADDMIESRPELLLYARRAAAGNGRIIQPLWKKAEIQERQLPPAGGYLLVTDVECERYASALREGRLEAIADGKVHIYNFHLLRATETNAVERSDQ